MGTNIMIRLDNFLKKRDNEQVFSMLGKTLTVENGWITMCNNKKNKKEEIKILSDEQGRVRIKGHDTAIRLSKKNNSYEIDHIQLGNIDKDEINFSMRKRVDEDDNIKYADNLDNEIKGRKLFYIKRRKEGMFQFFNES